MSKVTNVNLNPEGSTLATMTTTVDIIWVVHNDGSHYDGYDLEDFIKALNEGEFNADHRVSEAHDYTFFTSKADALAFMLEIDAKYPCN